MIAKHSQARPTRRPATIRFIAVLAVGLLLAACGKEQARRHRRDRTPTTTAPAADAGHRGVGQGHGDDRRPAARSGEQGLRREPPVCTGRRQRGRVLPRPARQVAGRRRRRVQRADRPAADDRHRHRAERQPRRLQRSQSPRRAAGEGRRPAPGAGPPEGQHRRAAGHRRTARTAADAPRKKPSARPTSKSSASPTRRSSRKTPPRSWRRSRPSQKQAADKAAADKAAGPGRRRPRCRRQGRCRPPRRRAAHRGRRCRAGRVRSASDLDAGAEVPGRSTACGHVGFGAGRIHGRHRRHRHRRARGALQPEPRLRPRSGQRRAQAGASSRWVRR